MFSFEAACSVSQENTFSLREVLALCGTAVAKVNVRDMIVCEGFRGMGRQEAVH